MSKSKYARYELNQSPFYRLQPKAKLAKILQISSTKLYTLTHCPNLYREEELKKETEKSRLLEKPMPDLKRVQKRIEDLLKRVKLPNYVHAPAKGRSYISNAKAHRNALVVRTLDIEKYFISTPQRRIYWFFHKWMKCSPDVAGILAEISSFKDHLPTGSPSSPILSYFSHIDMWEAIDELVKNANCTLTVYMDDVTVSGNCVPDKLIWQIEEQFRCHGLHSNKKKEKHYSNKKSCEITGVILTKEGELKIPNRQHLKMYHTRQKLNSETDLKMRVKHKQRLKGLESQRQQIHIASNS